MTPDTIADAAAHKAMIAPRGSRRQREEIARKARLIALAHNVRLMRMNNRADAHSPSALDGGR